MSKRTRQSIMLETVERRLHTLNKKINQQKTTLKRHQIEFEALERIKEIYNQKEE